jgi:hypothetical protein
LRALLTACDVLQLGDEMQKLLQRKKANEISAAVAVGLSSDLPCRSGLACSWQALEAPAKT